MNTWKDRRCALRSLGEEGSLGEKRDPQVSQDFLIPPGGSKFYLLITVGCVLSLLLYNYGGLVIDYFLFNFLL